MTFLRVLQFFLAAFCFYFFRTTLSLSFAEPYGTAEAIHTLSAFSLFACAVYNLNQAFTKED